MKFSICSSTFSLVVLALLFINGIAADNKTAPTENDICSNICPKNASGLQPSSRSWSIHLPKLNTSVAYNQPEEALSIVNYALNYALIITPEAQGIYNIKTRSGMYINPKKLILKIDSNLQELKTMPDKSNLINATGNLAKHLKRTHKNILTDNIKNIINIANPKSLYKNAKELLRNFWDLIKGDVITFFLKPLRALEILLEGVLSTIPAVASVIVGLIKGVLSAPGALLNGNFLFTLLHNLFYFIDSVAKGVVSLVELTSDLTWHFLAKTGEAKFAVTVNGLIIIQNSIAGTVAEAGKILKELGLTVGEFIEIFFVV